MPILDLPNLSQFSTVATGLSWTALTRTEQGFYTQLEINRGLPAPTLVHYFQHESANWTVSPKLWQKTNLIEHSLMFTPSRDGPLRIVFARNVLTYFDLDTKRTVLRRVASAMAPGGYLLLGAAETTMGMDPAWEHITLTEGVVYRLKGGAK